MNRHFNRRNKSLLIISLVALFLAPLAVMGVNRLIDAQFQPDLSPTTPETSIVPAGCQPELAQSDFDQLSSLVVADNADGPVSARMAEIFTADQAGRLNPLPIGPQMSSEEDRLRRVEVLGYLRQNKLQTARELVSAAYVFQHGDCAEHYRLANLSAELAMKTGYEDAKWIYAATLDRYLMSVGQPQKYGTQYRRVGDTYELYEVDPETTDEERRQYNVPDLATAVASTPAAGPMSSGPMVQILESWWLTLIGIGLSALSVVLAWLDSTRWLFRVQRETAHAKPPSSKEKALKLCPFAALREKIPLKSAEPTRYNALAHRALLTAAVVYVLSIIGHYSQVSALAGNPAQPDSQSTLWLVIVMLAGLVLAIQVASAIAQWLKRNQDSSGQV